MSEISPTTMTEPIDTDIMDRKGRLGRIAIAVVFALLVTALCMNAMINSGRGPQQDPVSQASVVIMAIAMFLLTASTAHKIIVRWHENRRRNKS